MKLKFFLSLGALVLLAGCSSPYGEDGTQGGAADGSTYGSTYGSDGNPYGLAAPVARAAAITAATRPRLPIFTRTPNTA